MKTFIGIDPGIKGGIAFLNPGEHILFTFGMPETERDIFEIMRTYITKPSTEYVAILEQVHSMPKQGISSAFKFGMGYGGLRMLLTCMEIPFMQISPQLWQRTLGCLTKGNKNVTKAFAQQLFPTMHITHKTADALLLAEYGHRRFGALS